MSIAHARKNKNTVQTKRESSVSILDSSSQNESLQRKADMASNTAQREEAPRPNNTGMPDNLKSGIESLSGFSMDDVRVHYNSSKPATVQALAYTQGTDIHVAPGQEKHLPHEAWHVTQQMTGRVSPTTNINGMPVNDNAGLEHEADVMGEKAVTQRMHYSMFDKEKSCLNSTVTQLYRCDFTDENFKTNHLTKENDECETEGNMSFDSITKNRIGSQICTENSFVHKQTLEKNIEKIGQHFANYATSLDQKDLKEMDKKAELYYIKEYPALNGFLKNENVSYENRKVNLCFVHTSRFCQEESKSRYTYDPYLSSCKPSHIGAPGDYKSLNIDGLDLETRPRSPTKVQSDYEKIFDSKYDKLIKDCEKIKNDCDKTCEDWVEAHNYFINICSGSNDTTDFEKHKAIITNADEILKEIKSNMQKAENSINELGIVAEKAKIKSDKLKTAQTSLGSAKIELTTTEEYLNDIKTDLTSAEEILNEAKKKLESAETKKNRKKKRQGKIEKKEGKNDDLR